MVEGHRDARQQQAIGAEMLGKITIVPSLAVGGVANDRVGNVFEVAPDLVTAAGDRLQCEQGVAAVRVTIHRDGQFDFCQFPEVRQCGLRLGTATLSLEFIGIALS